MMRTRRTSTCSTLDFINTVAFGGVVLFVGHGVRRLLPALSRYNVPAPVIGGLLVAAAMLVGAVARRCARRRSTRGCRRR